MPWSEKQMKVIRAKAHGWNPPGKDKPFAGVSEEWAKGAEKEGIKPSAQSQGDALEGKGKKK
jgi:hypothetical protein